MKRFGKAMLAGVSSVLIPAALMSAAGADEVVTFHLAHTVQTPGYGVYVLGSLPELGSDVAEAAVRMWPTGIGEFEIPVLLPSGTSYTYQFIERPINVGCGGVTVVPIDVPQAGQTAPPAQGPRHKSIWAHSSIPQPILHWREGSGAFASVAMRDVGEGRSSGERRWAGGGFGTVGREIEFYLTDETGSMREPATGNYSTSMDTWFVQDGELFGYVPAASVSPLRREYDPMMLPTFFSTVLNEERPYRVVLPRGYDEHTGKRYPVVYAHDGQFWFEDNLIGTPMDPGAGVFAQLVRDGRVGECILVALDAPSIPHRSRDYIPPGDTGNTGIAGQADRYLDFLINEFKPFMDANYRTLPDREHTLTAGFSYSGACALYCAWDYNGVFSRAGSWSGSFWLANFRNRVMSEPSRPMRFYLDSGTDNFAVNEILASNLQTRASGAYLQQDDIEYITYPCLQHLLPDFGARIPEMFEFLLPASEGVTLPVYCPADTTTGAVPGQSGYGVPNGVLNNDDFFYYLTQFAAGNVAVADLTTTAVPGSVGYGVPNGVINNDDFFYYLIIFSAGC